MQQFHWRPAKNADESYSLYVCGQKKHYIASYFDVGTDMWHAEVFGAGIPVCVSVAHQEYLASMYPAKINWKTNCPEVKKTIDAYCVDQPQWPTPSISSNDGLWYPDSLLHWWKTGHFRHEGGADSDYRDIWMQYIIEHTPVSAKDMRAMKRLRGGLD